MRALILGAGGQVGRALVAALPGATALSRTELDIAEARTAPLRWDRFDVLVNAAGYTCVDAAETPEGRPAAWRINAEGPSALAALAARHELLLVHLSSEYVFDGRQSAPYTEECPIAPLSAYGASKAAGDIAVRTAPRHYLIRPTWVVGQGRNFVATMLGLARRGVSPTVVADQVGRPTFADDVAAAIVHLLTSGAPHGTYHVTGGGEPASWADVAQATFACAGRHGLTVRETTTAEYNASRPAAAARPLNSVLALDRAIAAGVPITDWRTRLAEYVSSSLSRT